MLSKLSKRMKGEGGFTLIELLVVIIIIAILAAIAIPTFLGQRQKAQDSAAKSLVRNGMTAMESAYVDTRAFNTVNAAALTAIEPSIVFVADAAAASNPSADAQQDQVNFHSAAADTYAIGSQSQSGKDFSVFVDKGAGGGTTYYIDGASATW